MTKLEPVDTVLNRRDHSASFAFAATAQSANRSQACRPAPKMATKNVLILRTCNADMTAHGGFRWRIVTGYVGEDGIEPNVPYVVNNGVLVRKAES